MANTFFYIGSTSLSYSTTQISFNSIPQTYTDLMIQCSIRSDNSTTSQDDLQITFNGDTSTLYSYLSIYGDGTNATAVSQSGINNIGKYIGDVPVSLATASTFNNVEIYIPSYTSSFNKITLSNNGSESKTGGYSKVSGTAGLYRSTNAISSITLQIGNLSYNFISGSTFFLYGIKNS